jgi:hypothetical protein
MANKITVHFEASGAKPLRDAINALAKAQGRLEGQNRKTSQSFKGYGSELNKVNKAQDKTAKGLFNITNNGRLLNDENKKVQHSFATIRSQLLLVSFGMGLVSGSILKLVGLYAEQELAEKRLTVALGFRSEALIKQASALQRQTRFGDEAIIGAQAMLAAFIKDEDQLKKATDATLDLASAKGMDLRSAADLVAKSVGSSTNSLTRYGVEAEGAAGSTERLDSIVGNIKNLFGGFAKGELETTRGMLDATSNAIGDAGEAFGRVLLQPVLIAAKALKAVAETANPDRIRAYGIALGVVGVAANRAAIMTALFSKQIVISRTALIRSGLGAFIVALGEAVHQMNRFNEVSTDFDYFLMGLGIKTADLTEEEEKRTNVLAEETQAMIDSSEETAKRVKGLEKQLELLELNADEMSRSDQLTKALIESEDGLTLREVQLHQAIIDITIARKEEAQALEDIKIKQEEMMLMKKDEASFNMSILGVQASLNSESERDLALSKARISALSQMATINEGLTVVMAERESVEDFLLQLQHEGTIGLKTNNVEQQAKINLILELLDLQEELINKNYAEAESNKARNKATNDANRAEREALALRMATINASIEVGKQYKLTGNAARDAGNIAVEAISKELQKRLMLMMANHLESIAKEVPFPASLLFSAAMPAVGAALVSAAFNAIPKFETGGLIGGQRHSQGGTLIEAERGEFVMSRNAVDSIGVNTLEAMNAGGGASIVINNPIISSDFVESELPELIAEAVRKGADFGMS